MEWTWCQARNWPGSERPRWEIHIEKNQISHFGSSLLWTPQGNESSWWCRISSMWPHCCWWCHEAEQDRNLFLSCVICWNCSPAPSLRVIPAVPVLANSLHLGAAPQGEMNIPIVNREACRCLSVPPGTNTQILRTACPFQPGFTSQPEPALEERRGLMAHTKSSRWPAIISAVHYANGNKVPGTCLPLYHTADWWKSHPNRHLALLKNVSMLFWRIFNIF